VASRPCRADAAYTIGFGCAATAAARPNVVVVNSSGAMFNAGATTDAG
jgi:hypothetical protein